MASVEEDRMATGVEEDISEGGHPPTPVCSLTELTVSQLGWVRIRMGCRGWSSPAL